VGWLLAGHVERDRWLAGREGLSVQGLQRRHQAMWTGRAVLPTLLGKYAGCVGQLPASQMGLC